MTAPIDPTLRALAEAFAAGEDCGPALADCLIDLGYPGLAWSHFWSGQTMPCRPGRWTDGVTPKCSTVLHIMRGDVESLDKEESEVRDYPAFAAYQAAQLRPRAGRVTADE